MYPQRPSRFQLALQTLGGWEAPWLLAALGRVLIGILAIILFPIALIGLIPAGIIWLLFKLGDRTFRATKILVLGHVDEID